MLKLTRFVDFHPSNFCFPTFVCIRRRQNSGDFVGLKPFYYFLPLLCTFTTTFDKLDTKVEMILKGFFEEREMLNEKIDLKIDKFGRKYSKDGYECDLVG